MARGDTGSPPTAGRTAGGQLDGAARGLGDRGLARGRGAAAWLCARRPPWRSTSPRTAARFGARARRRRGRPLGRPLGGGPIGSPLALPGSPREVYTTAHFSPDGDGVLRGPRRRARVPLGGRPLAPGASMPAPSSVAPSPPSSGKRWCPSRATSPSAPTADDRALWRPDSGRPGSSASIRNARPAGQHPCRPPRARLEWFQGSDRYGRARGPNRRTGASRD